LTSQQCEDLRMRLIDSPVFSFTESQSTDFISSSEPVSANQPTPTKVSTSTAEENPMFENIC